MPPDRTQEVDLIRSLALLGICVVNLPFLALPMVALTQPPAAMADRIAIFTVEALFQGKFFLLFSVLFGWGFGVQLAAAARAGRDPRAAYLRRLAGLAVIGVAHAVLVFHGDILILYALLGLALWPLRDAPVRRLVALAVAMVPVAAVCFAGLAVAVAQAAPGLADPAPGYLGSFGQAVAQRVADWTLAGPFILIFNGPLAFGAFALGLAAQRVGFFRPGNAQFAALSRCVPLLLAVAVPANLAYALTLSGVIQGDGAALAGFAALAVGGPALAAVYLVGIVTLARRGMAAGWAAPGRMSLTAYVAEGVVAGLIFNGYGLGLYGQFGPALLLAMAVGVYGIVHLACHLWLLRWQTGPLEWALRAIAQGRSRPPPR